MDDIKIYREDNYNHDFRENNTIINIPEINLSIKIEFPEGHIPDSDTFECSVGDGWERIEEKNKSIFQ